MRIDNVLEGNVFVGDFGAGGAAAHGFFATACVGLEVVSTARCCACASACACCCGIAAATEHAEIIGDDFKAGALLAFLVLPFAGLDAAFDKDERALLQILLGDFGLLAPDDNLVPLGAFLALAVFVFVRLIGGDGKIGDGLASAGVARFRIAAQAANENDFVNGH